LLTSVVIAAFLSGCEVHQTPDGIRLHGGDSMERVDKALGPPDFVYDLSWIDDSTVTHRFYLNHRCDARFRYNDLRGIREIGQDEMPDVERQARVFKRIMPRVRVGESWREVFAEFGVPDYTYESHKQGEFSYQDYEGPYRGRFEREPLPEKAICFWKDKDVCAVFETGRLKKVYPIFRKSWIGVFHQEPPGNLPDPSHP